MPLLALALGGLTHAAVAQERNLVLGLASGMIQRGLAHEPSAPTLLAGLDVYPAEGWTVGVSGSMLRAARRAGASVQLVGQAARTWPLAGAWSLQGGVQHYEYPLDDASSELRYDAARTTLAYGDLLSLSFSASPNARSAYAFPFRAAQGRRNGWRAWDLGAHWPLAPGLLADVGLGTQDLHRLLGERYVYGNAGLTWFWRDTQWSLGYVATDAVAKRLFREYAQNRWVFSVLWQL